MNLLFTNAYHVPYRVIWLQAKDAVELRVTVSGRSREEQVHTQPVQIFLDAASGRMLGIGVADNKSLRLGLWLRQHWEESSLTPGEPIPFGTVAYDQGDGFAYFSVWPDLSENEIERVERRRGRVVLNEAGELLRIYFDVTLRHRQDGLAGAVGYLANR
jgi:hypothetical protein